MVIWEKRKPTRKLYEFGIYNPLLKRMELNKMSEKEESKNKPDYNVSTPIKTGEDKTFWLRIGSAWKKENGISVALNALPINGKLFLGTPQEKEEK